MKKIRKQSLSLLLICTLILGLTACGSSQDSTSDKTPVTTSSNIVNIGATDSLGTLNPLNMDWTFINVYATSLMFLPLMVFNNDATAEGMLAESVTTDDNLTFHVKLKDDVYWSDGTPVTCDDVIFTILRMTSPEVANYNFGFYIFKGFDDNGLSPSGAEEIEGMVKIDDKNMEFVAKNSLSLQTFINNVCTWLCILPSHVLKDVPADQLLSYDWFNHPDVVDGPYILDAYDSAHYISYSANEKYYLGAPKIEKLNIKIVQGSELLAGLKSGEIDFIQPSMCSVPIEDWKNIEALDSVKATYTDAVCDQMTLINTSKITDARVRQAIVASIDRDMIVNQLLMGHGEVIDGFVCSLSPYYDSNKETIAYDPERAKQLLSEAGWDNSTAIQYYVNSGDSAMVKAAQIIEQYMEQVGFKVELHTVDFATLMTVAGSEDVDMFTVQYTITPNDYYGDIYGLVNMEDSWSGGYLNPDLDAALNATQSTSDVATIKSLYRTIDDLMISEVPMFSLYFINNMGVVSNRLKNAEPTVYGALKNVEQWEFVSEE